MKLLQKPASSDMVFLDTDFHNASLPAADYRVRPPYLSFHADIFRTQATPDIRLTGAIFQTRSPPLDLPWQTDSTDTDSIMASQSKTLGNTIIRQHGPDLLSMSVFFLPMSSPLKLVSTLLSTVFTNFIVFCRLVPYRDFCRLIPLDLKLLA